MAETPHPDAWRLMLRRRLLVVAVIFVAWTAVIQARLTWLQVVRHEELVASAERQQMRTLTVPAKRGDIVDRNGRVLATSVDVPTIYAVPTEIADPARTVAALCRALDECTSEFRRGLLERFAQRRPFVYVKRRVSHAEAAAVRGLDLDGIGLTEESRRFYPNRELLGPTLGFVGLDSRGLGGIEARWNDLVLGKDGKVVVFADARRHAYDRVERPPTTGASLELTIDAVLQHIVERELRNGIVENRAVGGVAIVMDPTNGEILAMASEPSFNPNAFARAKPEHRRNRAVQDIYEPGSTFKAFTASAAFEEGVINPETPIDCAPGHINIGSRRVRDVHTYGVLTFTDVIVKSSNVGAIKAGFRLGPERMARYVRRFGFGSRLSRDLPAEEPGIVWSPLNDSGLASVSMGYQIGVTPLQMVTAVSSIANGGTLFRPRIVRAVVGNGQRRAIEAEALRRTISPDTASTLTTVMEEVVERGTARSAQLAGYRIAGKTGTAAKLTEAGTYSKSEYMSSFVGFLPSRSPRVTVLVLIDTPRAGRYYGGSVAAPIFQRIASATVRHLGIPRAVHPEPPVVVARGPAAAVQPVAFGPESVLPHGNPVGRDGRLPDVTGMAARVAVRVLARAGLTPEIVGTGLVVEQRPAAGEPLEPGATVRLRLSRSSPPASQPAGGR